MIVIRNAQHTARVLRHLREQAGLTRKDLSQRIYISDRTIANREYGQRRLDTDALIDTARALGYDLALIPREDDRSGRADPLCVSPDGVCTCGEPEGHQGREDT
jgi:transcriptional regulator with XRE-family HTH domain